MHSGFEFLLDFMSPVFLNDNRVAPTDLLNKHA